MNLVKKIPRYNLCFNIYFAVACILYLTTQSYLLLVVCFVIIKALKLYL